MRTLHTFPARFVEDDERQFTPNVPALTRYDVRVVIDVVNVVTVGAFLEVTISALSGGVPVVTTRARIDQVGQAVLAANRRDFSGLQCAVTVRAVGRLRVTARVVASDPGEDVPEVI
jgi:hypothetical protein